MSERQHDELESAAAYALGGLDADERRTFEAHLADCAVCHAEVSAFRRVTTAVALTTDPVAPPAALKTRVLAKATGQVPVRPPAAPPAASRLAWLAAAAGILVAVATGLFAYYERKASTTWHEAATRASDEVRQLRAELARVRLDARQLANAMEVLSAPDLARVDLASTTPAAPSGRAFVSRSRGLLVSAAHLPALQPGRTYQLWLVLPQRPPIGAGVFGVNTNGSGIVVPPPSLNATLSAANDMTFAVTNEPAGGSPAPTTPILIAGTLKPN